MLSVAGLAGLSFIFSLLMLGFAFYFISHHLRKKAAHTQTILSFCKDGKLAQLKAVVEGERGSGRLFAYEDEANTSFLLDVHDGNDPLMVATKEGNTAVVGYLLDLMRKHQYKQSKEPGFYSLPKSSGDRKPLRHNKEGWSAVHVACLTGKKDILALYIQDDTARQLKVQVLELRFVEFRFLQN